VVAVEPVPVVDITAVVVVAMVLLSSVMLLLNRLQLAEQ
jgi:hypothetical protein